MARGRKTDGKEPVVLTAGQMAEFKEYKRNWLKALSELIRITDADQAGVTIPFILRREQLDFFRVIQTIRSKNIYRSLKRHYGTTWRAALSEALDGAPIPTKPSEVVKLILANRPENVLGILKEDMGLTAVTDSPVLLIVGKPRQIGLSTLIMAIKLLFLVFNPGAEGLLMSLDAMSASNVKNLLVDMVQEWPADKRWMCPDIPKNGDTLIVVGESTVTVRTVEGNVVRSFKEDIVVLTECAHYANAEKVTAPLGAIRAHVWVFLESTANGPTGSFYTRYMAANTIEAVLEALDLGKQVPDRQFVKWFKPWFEHEAYSTFIDSPEERQAILDGLDDLEKAMLDRFPDWITPEKLKWRREKIDADFKDQVKLSPEQYFMQEFPCDEMEMFQQKTASVFPNDYIQKLLLKSAARTAVNIFWRSDEVEPEMVFAESLANLRVHEPPIAGQQYIIGCDLGMGRRRDNSVIDVYSRTDGSVLKQVATFASNALAQHQVAHIAVNLAVWYNNAFLGWEANNANEFGYVVTNTLRYWNIYYRQGLDPASNSMQKLVGFQTTNQAKVLLVETFKRAIDTGTVELFNRETIRELELYAYDDVENPKSPMNAPHGEKDDRVIAAMLACFLGQPDNGAPTMSRKKVEPVIETKTPLTAVENYESILANMVAKEEAKLSRQSSGRLQRFNGGTYAKR